MKPETEIRNLRRSVNDFSAALERECRRSADYQAPATKAERECAEWKARFDVLLRREEPKP